MKKRIKNKVLKRLRIQVLEKIKTWPCNQPNYVREPITYSNNNGVGKNALLERGMKYHYAYMLMKIRLEQAIQRNKEKL